MARAFSALSTYRNYVSDYNFLIAALSSTALVAGGIVLNIFANIYATERASNYVTDIILSNTSALDVDTFFVWGTFILSFFVIALVVARPQYLPFTFSSLGIFYIIRTFFVTLTHLGPFPDRAVLDVSAFVAKVLGGSDMFFSGHTGAPFLLALVFWHTKWLRYLFLTWSVFFAAVVLLGHLHYSIDVMSAYFITYTIFHICLYLFPSHKTIFENGISNAA